MKVGEVYGGDWLRAEHIKERAPVTLQITRVGMHEFDDRKNPGQKVKQITLGFRNTDKVLGLNWTNANVIMGMYGDETDMWIGKPVTLEVRQVEAFGKYTDAIRVQEPHAAPIPAEPEPPTLGANGGSDDDFADDIPF